jgi:hypothetical protein
LVRSLEKEAAERRRIVLAVRIDDAALTDALGAIHPDRIVADFRSVHWEDPRDVVFRRELDRLLAALR